MCTKPWRHLVVAAAACALAVSAEPRAGVLSSGGLAGERRTYVASKGETLTTIGARFGVDVKTMVDDNDLPSSGALKAGHTLQIDNRHVVPAAVEPGALVINLPQRLLFYADEEGVTALPVAVGRRDWQTPRGSFTVVVKETDPTWDVPASIRQEARLAGRALPASVPPGPNNPLGRFWLGLSAGSVGIHGTNAPSSIYRAATHGCVRLHPDDIAWLFPRVSIGTSVRTIYEPVLMTAVDDEVFLEAHPDVYRRAAGARETTQALAAAAGLSDRVDWALADQVLAARHGVARAVSMKNKGDQGAAPGH